MAQLCLYALKNDLFCRVVNTKKWQAEVTYQTKYSQMKFKRNMTWDNTNILLNKDGYKGIKTGITTNAGGCLTTFYKSH